ncbi:MAG: hypothetical protein KDA24_12985 [Deltaproteobacteria bacterium]|nr:hypothetical protein [Deltaproteobacteria bacterium]
MRSCLLLAVLAGVGCTEPALPEVNEVESIGALSGTFSCALSPADAGEFDLGPASFEGALVSAAFTPGLRTQGCFARRAVAARGDVVQVVMLQQTRFQRAQVLELNLPIDALQGGAPLFEDDRLVFVGRGGFGSLYSFEIDGEPVPFARTAGGTVRVSEWTTELGGNVAGSFDDLRMGAL